MEMVIFSMKPYSVLFDGDIVRNRYFWMFTFLKLIDDHSLVECSCKLYTHGLVD